MITDYLKYVNDDAYVVKREIKIDSFVGKGQHSLNMEWVKAWRDWLQCDHVLKTQTHFIFCQRIEDAKEVGEHVEV